jgi:hypothetical protein
VLQWWVVELSIQHNRMRLVERLDNESLHALFDNHTTKSERKKRKKAEQTAGEQKVAKNLHLRIITNRTRGRKPTIKQRHRIRHQTRHLRIARKNGQLPHKPAARVRKQRMSNATFVKQALMFVLNPDKNNVIALQLGKSVGPGKRIKPRKMDSRRLLVQHYEFARECSSKHGNLLLENQSTHSSEKRWVCLCEGRLGQCVRSTTDGAGEEPTP